MAGCGPCSLNGGTRRKTRKDRKDRCMRRHSGGGFMDQLKSVFSKAADTAASKEVNMGGGRRRRGTRRRTHYRHPKKGQRSRTRRGRLDFTTKKSSRVFNRRRHYQRRSSKGVKRRPFRTRRRR